MEISDMISVVYSYLSLLTRYDKVRSRAGNICFVQKRIIACSEIFPRPSCLLQPAFVII